MSAASEVDTETPLDERLCLALHRTARAVDAAYRPMLDELDLTYPQHLVLVALRQDGRSSVGAIGERLGLVSSTLSPLITRLEARGLLSRHRSAVDERRVEVDLTPEGVEVARLASGVTARVCEAADLSAPGLLGIVQQLHALEASLTAAATGHAGAASTIAER